MKLLLDTHIWLWGLLEPERLAAPVREALETPGHELWLSSISVWEASLLIERGRVQLPGSPHDSVRRLLRALPAREAPVTHDIAVASRQLRLACEDPADRFIAATAQVMGLTLVTADDRLLATTEYAVLANR